MAEVLHYICPTCGSDVEVGKACPGCPKPRGKRRTKKKQAAHSWQQDSAYDGLDLPDDAFDDAGCAQRGSKEKPPTRNGIGRHWWWLALFLLVLMLLGLAAVIPFWF